MAMNDATSASPLAARLFVGLLPPEEVRDAMVRHVEQWSWPRGASRVVRDKLHLTLHFLGSVPRDRIPVLVQGLAVRFEPFELRLDHGELWSGGVAVLRPAGTPPALRALHERLHRALDRLEQASARQHLQPHVTLARHAQGARPPAQHEDIPWVVDSFALIESDLRSSQYVVRHEYRQGPARQSRAGPQRRR